MIEWQVWMVFMIKWQVWMVFMIEWQVWILFMTHLREPHDYLRHRLLHPWRVNWLPGPDPVSYLTPLNPEQNIKT